jgi:hypothetical protein
VDRRLDGPRNVGRRMNRVHPDMGPGRVLVSSGSLFGPSLSVIALFWL